MTITIRPRHSAFLLAAGARPVIHPGRPRSGRTLLSVVWALLLVGFLGCATSPAYKTLYAVGHATDAAVKTYLDLVVDGKVRTNDVPRIMLMYDEFQALYRAAEAIAEFSPTAKAGTNITAKASTLIGEVAKAKGTP